MKFAKFSAVCPMEIGDQIIVDGIVHTVTDIACTHYVWSGRVEFRFELDGSGNYGYRLELDGIR